MIKVLVAVRFNGDTVSADGESWPSLREARRKLQATVLITITLSRSSHFIDTYLYLFSLIFTTGRRA